MDDNTTVVTYVSAETRINFSMSLIEFVVTVPETDPSIAALAEHKFQYKINFGTSGDLSRTAPIMDVKVSMMNATNCWSNIKMTYNTKLDIPNRLVPFLNISGEPLFCDIPINIKDVKVEFRPLDFEEWLSLPIHPTTSQSGNAAYKGFSSLTNYVHLNIHFFEQLTTAYSDAERAVFVKFYKLFIDNRICDIRLVLTYEQQIHGSNGDKIEQIVIGNVPVYATIFDKAMNDSVVWDAYTTSSYITVIGDLSKLQQDVAG